MKKIVIALLSCIITIAIILEISYSAIANSITAQEIKTSIKQNLLTGLIYDKKGNKTEIFNTIVRLTKLDEQTVEKLMNNETADEIITDVVNSIYDYNLTGNESVKYTEAKVNEIVINNMDKILKEINYPLTSRERQEILEYTKKHATDILETIYSTDIGDYVR